jgi:hypothetical protein
MAELGIWTFPTVAINLVGYRRYLNASMELSPLPRVIVRVVSPTVVSLGLAALVLAFVGSAAASIASSLMFGSFALAQLQALAVAHRKGTALPECGCLAGAFSMPVRWSTVVAPLVLATCNAATGRDSVGLVVVVSLALATMEVLDANLTRRGRYFGRMQAV